MEETVKAKLETDLAAKDAEITSLKAEVAKLTKQVDDAKAKGISDYLSAAVASGKIADAEKEHFAKLAALDFEAVKQIIDAKTTTTAQSQHASLAAMVSSTTTASEEKFKGDWDALDKANKLEALKAENPALFKQKFNERFNK